MLPIGMPAIVALGASYAKADFHGAVGGVVGVIVMVLMWFTSASLLGSVTALSPVSRDPAPAARINLAVICASAVLTAALVGVAAGEQTATILGPVLLGSTTVVLVVTAMLFATEDTPACLDVAAPFLWRGHPLTGALFVVAFALLAMALVQPLSMRAVAGPLVSASTALCMVPFVASCAGLAALTRLLDVRRMVRRFLAVALLLGVLIVPLLGALLLGHFSLGLAPPSLMLWLHPAVLVVATRPAADVAGTAVGPLGFSLLHSFVIGHVLLASATLALAHFLGKRSPRMG
jgi:hypothetical protein